MKSVFSYKADIYVGLKTGYEGPVHDLSEVRDWLQKYVERGLAVTLTKTEFIYTGGNEPGVVVGLINYPRFPSTRSEIHKHAEEIAHGLMTMLGQQRVSIVFPEETVMLENPDS